MILKLSPFAIACLMFSAMQFFSASHANAEETQVSGDAEKGARIFRKCQACHQVGADAKPRVGPVLNGIVGRTAGSFEDFKYSSALQEKAAEGLVWTPEELDAFLTKPRNYLPGTIMSFAGLRKETDREDVIAYLASFTAEEVSAE